MLYELDQVFLRDEDEDQQKKLSTCQASCMMTISDKGVLSLMVTFIILVIGIVLLVLARGLQLPLWVDELSGYIISAGVFGLASGGTNWIAIVMLFYKIPLLVGSG